MQFSATIDERTKFSWPVVAALGSMALTIGGGFFEVRDLRGDVDRGREERLRILAKVELLEREQAEGRAEQKLAAAAIVRVEAVLTEMRGDFRQAFPIRAAKGTLP